MTLQGEFDLDGTPLSGSHVPEVSLQGESDLESLVRQQPLLDATSSRNDNGTGTDEATWSHTVANQADRILMVAVATRGGIAATGITYNGVALTKINHVQPGGDMRVELWYLLDPDVGTFNIVASFDGTQVIKGGAISYYGVDVGGTPVGAETTDSGSGATNTIAVASDTGTVIVDAISTQEGAQSLDPTETGQVQRVDVEGNFHDLNMSDRAGEADGFTDMSWESPGAPNFVHIGVAVYGIES